ncbi:MAG: 16S rRNA (adenine(1518)-N(6)/adenine(1519)-N(6))-dimethyltransferase RsmA [Candidatus Omnitrophica bacterium]|nr:16S rRNA (adenine(1518)-N(6)/adenine(1519)-N(6))-dimethyltransferase RsmA [Candidatus Omnitrophota bacterium]
MVDKNILNKIVNACDICSRDIVLEIGSGGGELTEFLAKKAKMVYAVEIDNFLCEVIRERFAQSKNIKVICADILKMDLSKKFKFLRRKMVVVGNIPYYISTPIIEHLFSSRGRIKTVFLTLQKEFAERVVAACGSKAYGALSCFIRYYSHPQLLFRIPAGCFFPVPKVDSAFVRLDMKKSFRLSGEREKMLFTIIRTSFNQRRKTLRNSLKDVISADKLFLFFEKYRIRKDIRPDALSLQDFVNLSLM